MIASLLHVRSPPKPCKLVVPTAWVGAARKQGCVITVQPDRRLLFLFLLLATCTPQAGKLSAADISSDSVMEPR